MRFDLFYDFQNKYDGTIEKRTHNIVRELNMPIDKMLFDFKHKVRKNIKKAINSGLIITSSNDEVNLQGFLNIYYKTMERTGAKEEFFFNPEFFHTIDLMKNNIIYFNVLENDVMISTELVLYDNNNNNCYSYLGATLTEYFSLRPNELLKYEIIKVGF